MPSCWAPQIRRSGYIGYICTLDLGHNGDHEAVVDGTIEAAWPSKRAPSRLISVSSLGDPYTPAEEKLNRIFDRLNQRIGAIIMGAAEDQVRATTEQLNKAKAEIDAEVTKLQESGVSDDALAGLKSVSQSLDDRNADAEPVPDPVTDTSE